MVRSLLHIVVVLVVLWVLIKLVFDIVGAVFHLLLVAAVVVGLYALIKAGAYRRI
ncbi:MAG: DUF5670 family protein [Actinomycetota bacterium]|nr:DUF5670 family protein [Actinomycetota bacterium]